MHTERTAEEAATDCVGEFRAAGLEIDAMIRKQDGGNLLTPRGMRQVAVAALKAMREVYQERCKDTSITKLTPDREKYNAISETLHILQWTLNTKP
ncbi:MAG: hypothetical protein QGD93_10275 [Actinomycetota bacterium]|nr:hypothetical protein [Actinomycetota bacterium]